MIQALDPQRPSSVHDARKDGLVQPAGRCPGKEHDGVVAQAWHAADATQPQSTDTGAHYGQGFLFARPAYPMPAVTWPPASGPKAVQPGKAAPSYPPPAA